MMESEKENKGKSMKGYILVVLSALFLSFQAIIGKIVLHSGMSPVELSTIQFGTITLAMIFFSVIIQKKGILKEGLRNLGPLSLFSIIGVAGTTFFLYKSLETLNAGVGAMLLFTNPVFVCIYFIATGKRVSGIILGAMGTVIIGCALAMNVFSINLLAMPLIGIVYGVLASMCYAFYNVYYDLKLSTLSSTTVLLFSSLIGTLTFLILAPDTVESIARTSISSIGMVSTLAVLVGIFPAFFLYGGIQRIGAEKASIVAAIELPFTLLIAFLVLGEGLKLLQLVGVLLIVIAVFALKNENWILKQLEREYYIFGWDEDEGEGFELIERIKQGKKTATCSFKEYYQKCELPMPYKRRGKTVTVVDRYGVAHCRVLVKTVFDTPFMNPSMELVNGEGFRGDQKAFIEDCKLMWEMDMPGVPLDEKATLIAEVFTLTKILR